MARSHSTRKDNVGARQQPARALEELRDPSPKVRIKAARWLAHEALGESLVVRQEWMANRGTTGPIIEALDDPEPEVAYNAVVAIAEITRRYFRDSRAYPRVVPLLQSKRRQTRFWAIQAAANLRGERCIGRILPLVRDRSPLVRGEVLRTLIHLAPLSARNRVRTLEVALDALKDSERNVRSRAATLLGRIGDRAFLKQLRQALRKEDNRYVEMCMRDAVREIVSGRES